MRTILITYIHHCYCHSWNGRTGKFVDYLHVNLIWTKLPKPRPIRLFTLEGKLVRRPEQIKDKQTYVATGGETLSLCLYGQNLRRIDKKYVEQVVSPPPSLVQLVSFKGVPLSTRTWLYLDIHAIYCWKQPCGQFAFEKESWLNERMTNNIECSIRWQQIANNKVLKIFWNCR